MPLLSFNKHQPLSEQRDADAPRTVPALDPITWFVWGAALVLVYGYELFNFSLSIDEELHTFDDGVTLLWLQGGRWGMALVSLLLRGLEGLPVLSTALFGAGLLGAAHQLAAYYRKSGLAAQVLGLSLITSPIWPHLVEFNSLSHGIGLGLALCAVGVRLLEQRRPAATALAVAALVFASGIYQTLLLAAIVMAIGGYIVRDDDSSRPVVPALARDLAFIVAAGVLSSAVQWIAMHAAHTQLWYVDLYWRLQEYATRPVWAARTSAAATLQVLLGTNPFFLGKGAVLAVAPLVAFTYSLFSRRSGRRSAVVRLSLFLLAVAVCVVPIFISVGTIPARALTGLPFLVTVALLSVPLHARAERTAIRLYLGAALVCAITIAAQLFYSDHVARERDFRLASSVLVELEKLRSAGQPLHVALVGQHAWMNPPVKHVEVFGSSFFEQDGGNVWRVVSYFTVIGAENVEAVALSCPLAAEAARLPAWPAAGSVSLVEGTALIKLGELTESQKSFVCSRTPDCRLCR